MENCPFIRVWYNKTYIPTGNTLHISTNTNQIELSVKNTGLGDLNFKRAPTLRITSLDDVLVSIDPLKANTISHGQSISLLISFSGSFQGFIVLMTNDIQMNYYINLFIEIATTIGRHQAVDILKDTTPHTLLPNSQLGIVTDSTAAGIKSNWLLVYVIIPTAIFLVISLSIIAAVLWKNMNNSVLYLEKQEESTTDGIQITEEEESSGVESTEDVYSPDKDKFFLGSTKPV